MSDDRHGDGRPADRSGRPVVNTHIHLPPNFSAFETAEDAVATAVAEDVRVVGASNFHDHRVYARFADAASSAGIVALFGREFIAVVDQLRDEGIKINDPGNPGRIYLCGKGINPFATLTAPGARIAAQARDADTRRIDTMIRLVRDLFDRQGVPTALTADNIGYDVAQDAGVPSDWVVLQERHVAKAFQEAVFLTTPPERRRELLGRLLGRPFDGSLDRPIDVQEAIRTSLMKSGRPAFVPESAVSFDDAYRLILELDGIPCYPTLADGASPICQWEAEPAELARRLLERGVHVAELIPIRNSPAVVDAYVDAFRAAGILVMAGTEHNTSARIPLQPRCVDGSLPSPGARAAFWEATCVTAAHQHLRASGGPGYVDGQGRLNPGFPDGASRIRWFAELGEDLIRASSLAMAR